MKKIIFFKRGFIGILVVWFLLCILPGDCLVLGCAEKDSFHCTERESAVLSHNDTCPSIPEDKPHCQNCCVLCAHNLVLHLFQNPPFSFTGTPGRFKTISVDHPNRIFQTIIYHPPRLFT
ncbi:MAG: hypothetical protein HYV59_03845 [Planctomycetes bacterium]|nr:hypothetical protein [Planctomycetota bacterium]